MTSCAACRGGPGCSIVWTCCLCPAQGGDGAQGLLAGSHSFMPGMQQVPCLRYLVQLPISYRNSQLLSSVKLPGIDKGLVRDFNLAQIIGLRWNLLPISFRLANTNTWSLILHKCNRPQCHMELIRAASHCWSILICVCTWWVVRDDNLLQPLIKLRQMIYSN